MKKNNVLKKFVGAAFMVAFLAAGTPGWGGSGAQSGKPPEDPAPPPEPRADGFYFWRLGHMDGPHDSSKALGISRDGKVAVGSTLVVDFWRAWRLDIDWAINTEDLNDDEEQLYMPPLYNELQVQENLGVVAPSEPSAAYAASDMTYAPIDYDLRLLTRNLDWGGSRPVGTITGGTVSYAIEWLLPVLDSVDEGDYVTIPDFGGGLADMRALDVTADGIIMVGYGTSTGGPVAFRADMSDPLLPVVKTLTITDSTETELTLQSSVAEAVSADGTVIAGYGGTATGNRAFVATVVDATTDPITLQSVVLPNVAGGSWAEAYALTVTPEGVIYIAGRSDSPKGPQACIWFVDATSGAWVVKGLGGLSKDVLDSVANAIVYRPGSAVGDLMVVGRSKSILYPSEAFVWTGYPVLVDPEYIDADGNLDTIDTPYKFDLEYILTKTGVAETSSMGSEWILNEATGIACNEDVNVGSEYSPNCRIVGWGTNPEGGIEAWTVTGFPYNELLFTKE